MISLLNFRKMRGTNDGTPYATKEYHLNISFWRTYMIRSSRQFALLSSVAVSLALPGSVFGIQSFSVGGNADPASIQATVDAFRAAAGDPNNGNAPGTIGGRREINWDGGGNNFNTTISPTPFDGFLNTRGALFTTTTADPKNAFVQAPPDALDPDVFGVFSPERIFSPIGSNITDVSFFIPGTNGSVPATVSGFGAVFTDVNRNNSLSSTTLQFFDISNNLIFNQAVPIGVVPKQSLSFLGAVGTAGEEIYRVRITTGNTPFDVVAMDDFIYPEPKRVPESGGIGLMGLGLGAVLFFYRRSLAVS
jgi:hypothetical protein